jgi:hypothetical protein
MVERTQSFVAECFWPGVERSDLAALDLRIEAAVAELVARQTSIRYVGSILLEEDEVVLCQFEGAADAVGEAVELAEVPFERLLEASRSPWSPGGNAAT